MTTDHRRLDLSTNSLYNDKDIPYKCMVVFYKFLHVFFGLDFGFVECKVLGIKCTKLPTIIQCIFIFTITVSCTYTKLIKNIEHFLPAFMVFMTQYYLYLFIFMRIKKETKFFNLFHNLRAIDSGLHVRHSSYNLESKLLICLFLSVLYRIFMFFTFFYRFVHNENSLINVFDTFINILVLVTGGLVIITCTFMFSAINCRLNTFKLLLKTKQSGFLSMQYLYRSIVDIAEQHKEAIDPVLFTSLAFNIPQAMAVILQVVKDIRHFEVFEEGNIVAYIIIIEMLLLTISPAICAGMLTSQAKEIKVILHDILLKQEYGVQYRELERFIRYVEARGCQFRVCKLMPLNASLLKMVVSFCVTYLIVIIQFTYK